jgi:hypothetical protein
MNRQNGAVLLGFLLIGATLYLMSRPNCNRGCKTLLEHLLTHELDALLGGAA